MKRVLLVTVLVLLSGVAGWTLHWVFAPGGPSAPARARNEGERRVLAALTEMKQAGDERFHVGETDGRMMRLLVESVGAKHVVEVGTSTGYSGLWLNLGLQATGGRLTTFELDPNRAATARRYFQKAGVDQQATVVVGDAHKGVAGITEPVDLVFLDADKEGYVDYLEKLLPRMRPGGLILAHNVTRAPGYLERVSGDPNLETMLFMHGGGMAITMKKR